MTLQTDILVDVELRCRHLAVADLGGRHLIVADLGSGNLTVADLVGGYRTVLQLGSLTEPLARLVSATVS